MNLVHKKGGCRFGEPYELALLSNAQFDFPCVSRQHCGRFVVLSQSPKFTIVRVPVGSGWTH